MPGLLSDDSVAPSELKILNALALMEQIGASMTKGTLGFFAGYSEGGRFDNLLGALRNAKGLIHYPAPGFVELTDAGRILADANAAPVRSLNDLHELWLSKLPPSEGKVLRALLEVFPDTLTRDELGQRTGYSPGGRYDNILGRLRSLGTIEYPERGSVVASRILFPEGLR